MDTKTLDSLALQLHVARMEAKPVGQISKDHPDMTRNDAYAIQERHLRFREGLEEKLIGFKMGLTSEAKRKQMNLDSPLYGFLTDKMQVKNAGLFSLSGSIHPKIEPEIAFFISKNLKWPVTREDVLESCSGVAACLEIIDSRYTEFKYFSMEDVIADNSSSCRFVLGEWVRDFKNLDLTNLEMKMYVDEELVQSGNSKDISNDPVISVIDLCQMLSERGHVLKAGSVVLAGAATPAVPLKPTMQIELRVPGLNSASVSIDSTTK